MNTSGITYSVYVYSYIILNRWCCITSLMVDAEENTVLEHDVPEFQEFSIRSIQCWIYYDLTAEITLLLLLYFREKKKVSFFLFLFIV